MSVRKGNTRRSLASWRNWVWFGAWVAVILLMVPLLAFGQTGSTHGGPQDIGTVSITGGLATTPIAVPPPMDLSADAHREIAQTIASAVEGCLNVSGYFELLGSDTYFFDPSQEGMNAASINFDNWYAVAAQALVKTSFRVAGNDVALDFRLFSIAEQNQIAINWTAGATSAAGVRQEAYAFANAVIEHYSGSPGVCGTSIAFAATSQGARHIYTIGMDGLGMERATTEGSLNVYPSWGPNGELMYTSYRGGDPDLYIGSDPVARAFSARPGFESGASLSPNGQEIAVTLFLEGSADIYILNLDGEIVRRCTDHGADDLSASWSPDGSRIAFSSGRSGGQQIYVMNSDCSEQRRVTFEGGFNAEPDWSPTGDLIAFTARDERASFDVFTVEPSTGFIRRITQDQGDNKTPSWSPDGRYLVFSSTRGGSTGSLYVSTGDGQHQVNITPSGEGFETPSWQR